MGLKNRIIAKLLFDDSGTLVKFRQFTESRRVVGNPESTLKVLSDQTLDEFHLCFLGRADCDLVKKITETVHTPVSVAGSVNTRDMVDELIRECGADRVVTRDDSVGWYIAEHYGVQAAIWPYTYMGDAGFPGVPEWAGEALLTSVDRDGEMTGFDLAALRFPWPVPVTLAGGCGKLAHVKEAFEKGAGGVAVASMFAFTDKSPIKLRSWLVSEGANVRA